MQANAAQTTKATFPASVRESTNVTPSQPISSSVLNALNIPEGVPLHTFCTENFQNICDTCSAPCLAAQTMAAHLNTLLAQVGEINAGNNAKFKVVCKLTNNLLSCLTWDDLTTAQDAAKQVNIYFNDDRDNQGNTLLDHALNRLELSYHKATHKSGRMGHAQEMQSDVRNLFNNHSLQDLAGMLAYVHDHVQIMNNGMGVGNTQYWGLNEIATAAGLSTLANEAGVSETGQLALLKVAGSVIPAGTAFGFLPGVGGNGKSGLGTIIEGMLRSGTLPAMKSEAGEEAIAMAYTLAICDTQRNNLAGLARATDEVIFKNAPTVYKILSNCSEKLPKTFGRTFFDNGRLSEAGLALCSKLTSTIEVFEEFPPNTFATPIFEDGKPNNPLSKTFESESLTSDERDRAIFQLIGANGSFGSADVAGDIESFSSTLSHKVLDNMKTRSILSDPKAQFTDAYIKFTDELKAQCHAGELKLNDLLSQIKSMGGSVR